MNRVVEYEQLCHRFYGLLWCISREWSWPFFFLSSFPAGFRASPAQDHMEQDPCRWMSCGYRCATHLSRAARWKIGNEPDKLFSGMGKIVFLWSVGRYQAAAMADVVISKANQR